MRTWRSQPLHILLLRIKNNNYGKKHFGHSYQSKSYLPDDPNIAYICNYSKQESIVKKSCIQLSSVPRLWLETALRAHAANERKRSRLLSHPAMGIQQHKIMDFCLKPGSYYVPLDGLNLAIELTLVSSSEISLPPKCSDWKHALTTWLAIIVVVVVAVKIYFYSIWFGFFFNFLKNFIQLLSTLQLLYNVMASSIIRTYNMLSSFNMFNMVKADHLELDNLLRALFLEKTCSSSVGSH